MEIRLAIGIGIEGMKMNLAACKSLTGVVFNKA